MARTDPLTTAAQALLNGHHPHRHHHHHHKHKGTPSGQAEFHLGSFHHYISGTEIGYGLGVILVIVIIALIVTGYRRLVG